MTNPADNPAQVQVPPMERYLALHELAKDRQSLGEEAFRQKISEMGAQGPLERMEEARRLGVREFASNLGYIRAEDVEKKAVGREIRKGARGPFYRRYNQAPCDMRDVAALATGTIASLARDGAPPSQGMLDHVRTKLGDEAQVFDWYAALTPVIGALNSGVAVDHNDGGGLPKELLLSILDDINQVNDRIGDGKIARTNIPRNIVSRIGARLAEAGYMKPSDFADILEKGYENHWHTKAISKHSGAAMIHKLRERVAQEGAPGLLVVLAGSSDGSNRSVAGIGEKTPEHVYEKLIYDNSLAVLSSVVRNKQFNNSKAYAMMDTGLAPQIVAVMLHGKVDMSIRVLAARQAIEHDGVDPMHVYSFLSSHRADSEVPHSLWRDFVKALYHRLLLLRKGDNPQATEMYQSRLNRMRKAFVEEILKPYAEAKKAMEKTDPSKMGFYQRNILRIQSNFIKANEFAADPEILDLLVEGARDGKALLELLEIHIDAKLPISSKLFLDIMTNKDAEVRATGLKLAPAMREGNVDKASQELADRVAREYEGIKDKVLTVVIPDYEKIEGEPRKLSRMKYNFQAANVLDDQTLIEAFVQASEKDPRTIPEEFRKRVEAEMARRQEPTQPARRQGL